MRTLLFILAIAGTAAAEPIVIENADVWVKPGVFKKGHSVVINGGRIQAVAKKVKAPKGARIIDGKGKVLAPGFIAPSAMLGMVEVDMVGHSNESFRGKRPVYAAYRATDGVNPRSPAVPVALSGGVTTALIAPRGGFVSGQWAELSLSQTSARDLADTAPIAMQAKLGRSSSSVGDGARGFALSKLRELFYDARLYQRNKRAFERGQSRELAAHHLDLAALAPVLAGRMPLVARIDRESDIRALLRMLREWPRVKLVIEGGAEAWLLADDLAKANVPVIYNPLANLPSDFDRLRVRNDGPALLAKAGVTVLFGAPHEWANVRNTRQLAGVAVSYGMPKESAMAAITSSAARVFGLRSKGTVEKGKTADLVLWSGDPLEILSRPQTIIIGGELQPLVSRQTRLLERYRTLR